MIDRDANRCLAELPISLRIHQERMPELVGAFTDDVGLAWIDDEEDEEAFQLKFELIELRLVLRIRGLLPEEEFANLGKIVPLDRRNLPLLVIVEPDLIE